MQFDWDEADIAILRKLVEKEKTESPRSLGYRDTFSYGDLATPDIYIAKAPDEGIPPRVDDVLGAADCEIYRIDTEKKLKSTLITRSRVLNLTTSLIEGKDYVVINRDKYGSWLVQSPTTLPELPFAAAITAVTEMDNGCLAYSFREEIYLEDCDGYDHMTPGGRSGDGGAGVSVKRIQAGTSDSPSIQLVIPSAPVGTTPSGSYTTSVTGTAAVAFDASVATWQGYVDAALGAGVIVVSAGITLTWVANGTQPLVTVDTTNLKPRWKNPLFAYNNRLIEVPSIHTVWRGYKATDETALVRTQEGNGALLHNTWALGFKNFNDGFLRLEFDGETGTTAIDFPADASDIEDALNADFDPVTFSVASGTGTIADPWVIEVTSDTHSHTLKADTSELRGGKSDYRFDPPGDPPACPGLGLPGFVIGGQNFLTLNNEGCFVCIQAQECLPPG